MGSEAKTTLDQSPETPSPAVTDLITELKTCFSSIDFQNVANLLMNREQDLLHKTHVLENEKDEILKENKKLKGLLKKKDAKIESLEKETKKLNEFSKKKDEKIESLEKENDGLKEELNKKQTEIGNYEKVHLDYGVRVLSLEKINKELLALEVKKPKNVVVAEGSKPPPPPGFEEILDPNKPKKEKDSKVPEIIEIDDDDDDEDDHGDRDLMKVSSKRKRDETKRGDSDDDKYISILRRKKVSREGTQDHKKDNYDEKIPTRTSHLKSPFCDSSSSDSDNEKDKISAKMDLQKDRWETREDMVKEFGKDDQLCLNAICALHKQDSSQKRVVLVRLFDASRISYLSRKKTVSELSLFDLKQCRQFAMDYSDKLFDIYKEKSDSF
ncbi:hypothetical protein CTI12_AA163330 [Artemisia annua]|uniref:Uncharacterized protein n=1 Tax=Artemisia annua TaxID=35608 RepID=A0A2U1PDR3_ARTAN|nr:hypothetical protein CTI12_AA163330 [Artemisia annua]